jgi:hypothetical protein
MGLLGVTLRVGIPSGFLYYTIQENLWSPGAGSPAAESRLVNQRKELSEAKARVHKAVAPYVDPILKDLPKPNLSLNLPDFGRLWNCGVKMTISGVADFDPNTCYQKMLKLFESKPETPPQVPDAKPVEAKGSESKSSPKK